LFTAPQSPMKNLPRPFRPASSLLPPLAALLVALLAVTAPLRAAQDVSSAAIHTPGGETLNQPARLVTFRDIGFGLFIHWSLDSQMGSVISHSMVGASEDYLQRFITDLPRTFNPRKFHPEDWAVLAKLAGMRYVVFTAKHHSGFCMWPTATTDFSIAKTPFQRDVTRELLDAFRAQGIQPGLYFSPDDFLWLHQHGKQIARNIPDVLPANNPGLMAYDRAQLRELLTNYGAIDYLFIDGAPEGLRELAWELQPNLVVTRGAIQTPEQFIPGVPLDGAWESCITMGTQWQYKPTNDNYKSGGQLISLLIETRAKGGNLLLNVGPKPDGELPIEQEERLREIALWMMINQESIYGVRPWVITNEGDLWFTKQKDADTLYVIVKTPQRWPYGEWRDLVLKSVRATPETTISVLGQNDRVLEYQPDVIPKSTFRQDATGLHLRAMHAQRIYNDRKWPNPVVLKLTHVKPALQPPRAETTKVTWDAAAGVVRAEGSLLTLGDSTSLDVGFEYRDITGLDLTERNGPWTAGPLRAQTKAGAFTGTISGLAPRHIYEVRAVVKHPLISLYGQDVRLDVP
jgi:alpha-L-fucosidase